MRRHARARVPSGSGGCDGLGLLQAFWFFPVPRVRWRWAMEENGGERQVQGAAAATGTGMAAAMPRGAMTMIKALRMPVERGSVPRCKWEVGTAEMEVPE